MWLANGSAGLDALDFELVEFGLGKAQILGLCVGDPPQIQPCFGPGFSSLRLLEWICLHALVAWVLFLVRFTFWQADGVSCGMNVCDGSIQVT